MITKVFTKVFAKCLEASVCNVNVNVMTTLRNIISSSVYKGALWLYIMVKTKVTLLLVIQVEQIIHSSDVNQLLDNQHD